MAEEADLDTCRYPRVLRMFWNQRVLSFVHSPEQEQV